MSTYISTNQSKTTEEREARCRRAHRLITDGGMKQAAACKRAGVSRAIYRKWREGQ